jgi:aconitase B
MVARDYTDARTILRRVAQLWICPPTHMDESQLKAEGMYAIFDAAGARTEMPGCSLCMGNQSLHRR